MINLPEINKPTQRKRIIMKFHMHKYIYNFFCTSAVFLCYPFKSKEKRDDFLVIIIQREKRGKGAQNSQKGYGFCIIFSGENQVVCD